MEHALAAFLSRYTYVAMVVLLSVAGVGVPISEDLTLLLGGALAGRGVTRFVPTLLAGYFGVLVGDVIIHEWGRRLGPAAFSHRMVCKALPPERQEKLRAQFARHGFLTIVAARHMPMLRAPIFFLSGASGLPLWKFLLADALSAALTVPAVVTLGYLFGDHLDDIRKKLHHIEWAIAAAAALLLGAWYLWRRHRRGRRDAEA